MRSAVDYGLFYLAPRIGLGDALPQNLDPMITPGNVNYDPAMADAWSTIQSQLRTELASQPNELQSQLDSAKGALINSWQQLAALNVGGNDAVTAAKKYVLAGQTVAGAVGQIEGLIAAAQGAPDASVVQAFTGTLVGTGVAILVGASAVTAGAGAAIVAGVGAVISVLAKAGFFGNPPNGQEVCGGVYCNGQTFVIGCLCVFVDGANPSDPTTYMINPGSANWRKFPRPNVAADAQWFAWPTAYGPAEVGTWSGSGAPAVFGSAYYGQRPIDTAFPNYGFLECDDGSLPPGSTSLEQMQAFTQFNAAFFNAWRANKEFELNGLKSQPDWHVLKTLVKAWNRAHEPGVGYDFVHQDVHYSNGSSGCSSPYVPYACSLVTQVVNQTAGDDADAALIISGRNVHIHTGPKKQSGTGFLPILLKTGGIVPPASAGMSTAAKFAVGAAVVAGTTAAGIGVYALVKHQSYSFVAKQLWKQTGGRAVDETKKLFKRKKR